MYGFAEPMADCNTVTACAARHRGTLHSVAVVRGSSRCGTCRACRCARTCGRRSNRAGPAAGSPAGGRGGSRRSRPGPWRTPGRECPSSAAVATTCRQASCASSTAFGEVRREQQVLQLRIGVERFLDAIEEHGPNDAAAAPQQRDSRRNSAANRTRPPPPASARSLGRSCRSSTRTAPGGSAR